MDPQDGIPFDRYILGAVIGKDAPVVMGPVYVMDIVFTNHGPLVVRRDVDGPGIDQTPDDPLPECRRLADKIIGLRIFSDENDKINLDLESVGGSILVVPQFTLYADCRKGNRPNFIQAGKPDEAERLYNYFTDYCRSKGKHVETGIFGADMKVELVNDGPFTIVLE